MRVVTRSPEETRALGERLGRLLRGQDLLCLRGDLGSGKTTFVSGLARGAGCRGRVMSPTFGLARTYPGPRLALNHLDLYRVSAGETGDIGIEDYLSDPRAACAVEWPEAGAAYYPADYLELRFSHAVRAGRAQSFEEAARPPQQRRGRAGRRIVIMAHGPRSRGLLEGLGRGLAGGSRARGISPARR